MTDRIRGMILSGTTLLCGCGSPPPPGSAAPYASGPASGLGTAAETTLVCSPSLPAASPLEPVRVRVFVDPADSSYQYQWTPSHGTISPNTAQASWDLRQAPLGNVTASVTVIRAQQAVGTCALQVVVVPPRGTRGGEDLVARALLLPRERELEGYGLYSYLLFGSRPAEAARDRYRAAVAEYFRVMPHVGEFAERFEGEDSLRRRQLNVAYLPLSQDLGRSTTDTIETALARYDYARSKVLLSAFPGGHRDGPYLVSVRTPLTRSTRVSREFLVQDLSTVPQELVPLWVAEFLNDAAQERFGQGWSPRRTVVRLRTVLAVLGTGARTVASTMDEWKKLFDTWVSWKQ